MNLSSQSYGVASTNRHEFLDENCNHGLHGFLERWIGLSSRRCLFAEGHIRNQASIARILRQRVEDNAFHQKAPIYSSPLSYINILYVSRARVSGAWSVLRLAG